MNKTNILIVGDGGRFGSEISRKFVASGYGVYGAGECDVTDENQVHNFFDNNKVRFEHLIYSVSAPIKFKEISKETADDFAKHFDVQVKGLLLFVQKLLVNHPLKSVLVIGSSCLFNRPPARLASYVTAKYALLGLVRSLAGELASKRVRVNMISPGLTGQGVSGEYPRQFIDITLAQTPLGRLVTEGDVASLAGFLVSDEAGYITGLNVPLDGGISMI